MPGQARGRPTGCGEAVRRKESQVGRPGSVNADIARGAGVQTLAAAVHRHANTGRGKTGASGVAHTKAADNTFPAAGTAATWPQWQP